MISRLIICDYSIYHSSVDWANMFLEANQDIEDLELEIRHLKDRMSVSKSGLPIIREKCP